MNPFLNSNGNVEQKRIVQLSPNSNQHTFSEHGTGTRKLKISRSMKNRRPMIRTKRRRVGCTRYRTGGCDYDTTRKVVRKCS